MSRKRSESGSLTLEAALTLPLFAAFLCLMMTITQCMAAQLALKHAASETVKTIAADVAPLAMLPENERIGQWQSLLDRLPDSLSTLVNRRMDEWSQPFLRPILVPVVDSFADQNVIDPDDLSIENVTVPGIGDDGDGQFGLAVTYHFHVLIPFFHQTLTLHASAYERIWKGGT